MSNRIKVVPFLRRQLTLVEFLEEYDLGLTCYETSRGSWYARLEGATTPRAPNRTTGGFHEPTHNITGQRRCTTQSECLVAACEYLTSTPRVVRSDGAEINLVGIEVTP